MLFIAAGMGGGTGTGAAPVIAKLAREKGILTVGVVTKPFHFEGSQRMKLAEKGIEELQQYVDTLLTIPNQNLFRIANEKTTFSDAFKMADDVLYAGVRGVTDLMVQPGMINLDFSDIKTVMSEMGKAMMGTGEAQGEGRAIAAAEAAIANPLIDDVSLKQIQDLLPRQPIVWGPKINSDEYEISSCRFIKHTEHRCFKNHNRDFRGRPEFVEWSYEMSWRLARLSELKHSKNEKKIRNYKNAIYQLMPNFMDISSDVDLIRLIALPSVMECIQEGFDFPDESEGAIQSTLTHGMPKIALEKRFRMLNYQHRMEPEISEFPRDQFYKGEALIDADTIQNRQIEQPFSYRNNLPNSIWINVNGRRIEGGHNPDEIKMVMKEVRSIIQWARDNPPTGTNDSTWHVAILTPY